MALDSLKKRERKRMDEEDK